mmetsp:Transcript_14248/g.24243  ORF Transcript_14248/g.24243 Transcript_14248/m.24243 type:complete len:87 (-) Transcript_14248:63-323(-)
MVERLVGDYINSLVGKEQTNGGFPDTNAMRVALFGQIAFKYEQRCQEIYKSTSEKIIAETKKEIEAMLNQIQKGGDTSQDPSLFLY